MGQTSEVPKSCHLDKVQYNPLQPYIRNHLATSYIPFRLHVHFCIQLWEKKLKQTKKFGSVNLFTAGRSCRPPSLLSYHAKLSIADVSYYRVDLESLHLCYLPIDNCIYWMVVIQLEPIIINSIVNF